MWQTLNQWDTDLFLAINSFGCRALDPVMMHVTDYTFVLLGGVALYFLWKRFGLRDTLWAIVFIALAITLSDQICGNYIRDLHIRLRPCHMEKLAGKFRSVREWETGYCGGLYGFVSAHAGNAFALATFAWSALRKYQPHIGWFVFVPAVVIAYSRIYIGVHMPGDVLVGGLIGAGCGALCAWGYRKFRLWKPSRKASCLR